MRSGAQQLALATVVAGCGAPRIPPYELAIAPTAPAVAAITPSATPSAQTPKNAVIAKEIRWETSLTAATDRARRGRLPTVIWLRADWDTASLTMERTTWRDAVVVRAAQVFVALRLDLSAAEGDAERLAERYDVHGLPAIVILDATGRRSATLRGIVSPEDLAVTLRAAAAE